jgi:hypothetical protein
LIYRPVAAPPPQLAELAFSIFLGIWLLIVITCIVLCTVGNCCMRLDDDPPELSDPPATKDKRE